MTRRVSCDFTAPGPGTAANPGAVRPIRPVTEQAVRIAACWHASANVARLRDFEHTRAPKAFVCSVRVSCPYLVAVAVGGAVAPVAPLVKGAIYLVWARVCVADVVLRVHSGTRLAPEMCVVRDLALARLHPTAAARGTFTPVGPKDTNE